MKNLEEVLIDMNRKAFRYGDGKAWNNKKIKVAKMHRPRGKVWMKLYKQQRKAWWRSMQQANC